MNNPWLKIPLSDYEAHMSMPSVGQSDMLANELSISLANYLPESIAVVGCAGGNGFERIDKSVKRVVGIDINPDYISTAFNRHNGNISNIELYVADIQKSQLQLKPVDLIFAGLVFEYVAVKETLKNLSSLLRQSGRLVTIIQLPTTKTEMISPTPYTSLNSLSALMELVPPEYLAESAKVLGFSLETERKLMLGSGKEFIVQVFHHEAS